MGKFRKSGLRKGISIVASMVLLLSTIMPTVPVFADGPCGAVACIGETKYSSLRAAIQAAENGETITMGADDNVSFDTSNLEILIDKPITIDGKKSETENYTLYGVSNGVDGWHDIDISGNGDVTIKNLNIENFSDGDSTSVYVSPIYSRLDDNNKLTLYNVKFEKFNRHAVKIVNGQFEIEKCEIIGSNDKYQQGIEINTKANGTINNTTISGISDGAGYSAYAVMQNGDGTTTITNTTISGKAAVAVSSPDDRLSNHTSHYRDSVSNGKIILGEGNQFGSNSVLSIDPMGAAPDYQGTSQSIIEVIGGTYEGAIEKSDNSTVEGATFVIKGGTFSDDPDNSYIGNYCSIKNSNGKYDVVTCPPPTNIFVTDALHEIPAIYSEDGDNIIITIEETKALLKKLLANVPDEDIATKTLLNTVINYSSANIGNILQIKEIVDGEYVLFVNNAGTQTKGFVQKNSILNYDPYAFKNGTEYVEGNISFDINRAIGPDWVDKTKTITSYNTVSRKSDSVVVGYTLNTNDKDGWFYAPKTYTITFKNGEETVATKNVAYGSPITDVPAVPEKASSAEYDYTNGVWVAAEGAENEGCDVAANVSKACTFVPSYTETTREYTITFNANGGTLGEGTENLSVEYGNKASRPENDPTKKNSTFLGWYNGNTAYDFDTPVTSNLTLTAKWKSKSTGGGSGGGSSKTTETNTGATANSGATASTGTTASTGSNLTQQPEVTDKQTTDNTGSNASDSDSQSEVLSNGYTREFNEAYEFAHKNGITTMGTIEEANMYGGLTRIAMAKMLSQYAINVLGKKPANVVVPNFPDVTEQLDADYDNGVTLAYQLGIMGIGIENFRPYDSVTRAEFATALSRMLFGTSDGEPWYATHLEKLMNEKIITNDDPNLKELRGYVMIMLMRSAQ